MPIASFLIVRGSLETEVSELFYTTTNSYIGTLLAYYLNELNLYFHLQLSIKMLIPKKTIKNIQPLCQSNNEAIMIYINKRPIRYKKLEKVNVKNVYKSCTILSYYNLVFLTVHLSYFMTFIRRDSHLLKYTYMRLPH